jgi:hypothetical protein
MQEGTISAVDELRETILTEGLGSNEWRSWVQFVGLLSQTETLDCLVEELW